MPVEDKIPYTHWMIRITPRDFSKWDLEEHFPESMYSYMAYVHEVGHETEKDHYHIVISLLEPISANKWKTVINNMGIPPTLAGRHVQKWNGELAAIDYMNKEDAMVVRGHRIDMLTPEQHKERYWIFNKRLKAEAKVKHIDAIATEVSMDETYIELACDINRRDYKKYDDIVKVVIRVYRQFYRRNQMNLRAKFLRRTDYDNIIFKLTQNNRDLEFHFLEKEFASY